MSLPHAGGTLGADTILVEKITATLLSVPVDADLRAYGSDRVHVVLVSISDAAGRVGTGFTYTFGPGCIAVRSMIEDVIAPAMTGRPVSHWPALHERLTQETRRLGRGVFAPAISAVDIAWWDLRATIAEKPLYRLLEGSSRPMPIYGSGRSGNALSTAALIERTEAYVAEGFSAVKLRVGARSPEQDAARVAAVRRAVGGEVRLMVDCNERLDLAGALWLAHRLRDEGVFWIEEPVPTEQLAAHRAIAERSGVAVAVGEHLVGHQEFATYANEGAATVLQPDSALGGGITEVLRVCAFAEAQGFAVSLHSLPELHVHLAAASPSVSYVEHFPILDGVIAEPIQPIEGAMEPPSRPGHGIVWDVEAIAAWTVRS
jgi:L-alanine-DL-glutamate epimerase-like enolase superfamily enzyme